MSKIINLELTKEEIELAYKQLSASQIDFEFKMRKAAKEGNTEKVLEVAETLKSIKIILNKLLGVV